MPLDKKLGKIMNHGERIWEIRRNIGNFIDGGFDGKIIESHV